MKVVESEPLLFSSKNTQVIGGTADVKDEEKVFDSFLNMNQATMLNI